MNVKTSTGQGSSSAMPESRGGESDPGAEGPGSIGGSTSAPGPSGPDGGEFLSVKDLHITFTRGQSKVKAVRGVSLEMQPGQIMGLVGESGSGKSVLGLTLLGLLPPKPAPHVEGSAIVCGTDMVAATPEERRLLRKKHLGAIFQDPMTSLNPTMRVGQQIAEAADGSQSVVDLLDSVGIPDPKRRAQAYPHELSGGLRQRVMIAMAIAGSPSLVIADEPTTALDVTVQAQVLELLRHLCDEYGTSFILVTHDLGVAAQIADKIAVLYGGRLAEVGPSLAMFSEPRHHYTRGLLRSRLLLETDRSRPVATLPGEPPDPRSHPPGCAFAPRCAHSTAECEVSPPELIWAEESISVPVSLAVSPSDGETTEGDAEFEGTKISRAIACVNPAELGTIDSDLILDPWTERESHLIGGPPPAVVVNDLQKRFLIRSGLKKNYLHALRGVTLDVVKGESVALVGESGCGKSTLLRAIAGLLPIDGGNVDFGKGARPQMVFQDAGASLTPWMTIGELIGERLREEGFSRAERKEKVVEALALVGLPAEVASAKAAQLSGGQRQRVGLARATVVPPDVLLCDEPTSALDVSLAATVLNLIGRLRRELGMAVIFVTHDLAAARMVADRIAVMYLGRIVEIGPSDAICSDPSHPYTKALLATVPGLGRQRVKIEGEPANPMAPPSGCSFHSRCVEATDDCKANDQLLTPFESDRTRAVACFLADGPKRSADGSS